MLQLRCCSLDSLQKRGHLIIIANCITVRQKSVSCGTKASARSARNSIPSLTTNSLGATRQITHVYCLPDDLETKKRRCKRVENSEVCRKCRLCTGAAAGAGFFFLALEPHFPAYQQLKPLSSSSSSPWAQCLKNKQKVSLVRAKRATLISIFLIITQKCALKKARTGFVHL